MATKQEMLEEKTVKELRQMARDKDLSGYSNLRKNELIEMMDENYSKAEVEAWPDLDEVEEESEETEEEEVDKKIEEIEPEELEAEIEKSSKEKPKKTLEINEEMIMGIAVVIVILIIIVAVILATGG